MAQIKESIRAILGLAGYQAQTDVSYLARGSFWTSFRFAIALIASIGTMIAFGNLLPKETYGVYSYLMSLAGSLGFLTLSGMSVGIIRAVARERAEVVPYALKLQLRYNMLATLGIGASAAYYGINGNSAFSISLLILALALPLTSAFHIFESVLIGKKQFSQLAILTSLSTLGGAAAIIATLFLTSNVVAIIGVYALTSLFPTMLIYLYVAKRLPKQKPAEEALIELRETSFHLTFAGIVSTLAQYLDKIVLFQVAGPAAVATYGFAIAGPERAKGLIKNWNSIVIPRVAERSILQVRSVFYKRFSILFLAGAILAAGYILAAPILFRWLFPQYLDSIIYTQAYALVLVIMPSLVYVGTVFNGLNMLRAVYIHSIGSQALRIILFLILGWKFEIWGLVAAAVLSYGLSTLYGIMIWEKESRRLIKENV